MFKFVVVSDLHFAAAGELAQTLDSTARFRTAVKHINEFHPDAEFCIMAGDLSDRGNRESYERLAAELSALKVPCHLTLGNHDDHTEFANIFGNIENSGTGCHDICIDAGGQRIIIMDSVKRGQNAGELTGSQIDWLRETLDAARTMPVILVLHHNIAELMVSTDAFCLQDNQPLLDALGDHPDVRHVISGHVHLNSSGTIGGIPFTTFAGCHYNVAPRRHEDGVFAPRFDGPGQYAVVWSGAQSTIVLPEDFLNCQVQLPPEAFRR